MGETKEIQAFDFDNFYKEYSYNVKTRSFLEYIAQKYDGDKINVLANLNEKDIINSLQCYIDTGVQYQITANNYFTYIKKLYDDLELKYGIKNSLFTDKGRFNTLSEQIKQFISKLKQSSLKEIASSEEYKQMRAEVDRVQGWVDENTVYEEIINRDSGITKHYIRLLSVIATRLVLDYGFKGNILTGIEKNDYDIEKNILHINGIDLNLSEDYKSVFNLYLEARDLAVSKNEDKTNMLFVNSFGEDFKAKEIENRKKQPNYGTLYCIAGDLINSVSMEKYAYYRIIQFIDRNVDVITLNKLTGFSVSTVERLLEYYNDEIKGLNPNDYFNQSVFELEDVNIETKKNNYIKCPICHKLVSADAREWIVVQYEDIDEPVLCCRYCGGHNEKNNI